MVMCEDERLKANRVGLLNAIGGALAQVADFSLLQPPLS
jgi:glycyl-tRNA synthetase beta subunit